MSKSQTNRYIIGVLGLVLVAGLIAFMSIKPTDNQNDPQRADKNQTSAPVNSASTQNFNFIQPDDWRYQKNALKDIQSLTPGQTINFGVVDSMFEDGFATINYYFATTAPDLTDENKSLQSIYRYDSGYQFERLYKLTTDASQPFTGIRPGAHIVLHAIGQEGYTLIVLAEDVDDSPGPCTEVLTLGRDANDLAREMLSLNVLDPYAKGLEPYRVPDELNHYELKAHRFIIPSD